MGGDSGSLEGLLEGGSFERYGEGVTDTIEG